ncbi:MAG: hypothetical protein OJF62_001982 [Pseudolabrys sp.]|nr:hypothetical protein [Pseudolabrys sp.]
MRGGAVNIRLKSRWLTFVSRDAEWRRNEIGHFASGGVKVTW